MTWVRLDDQAWHSDSLIALSHPGFRLYVAMLAYSAYKLSDGVVSRTQVEAVCRLHRLSIKASEELQHGDEPLWSPRPDGGWDIKDYLTFNPSREEVLASRGASRGQRVEAGKRSAAVRRKKYGTAQPARPSNEAPNGTSNEPPNDTRTKTERAPERPSNPVPVPIVTSNEVTIIRPLEREAAELCELLADRMVENGCKRPTVNEVWLAEARRLLDRDERPYEEARELVDWCQQDDFWKANIHSIPTFRKQYDKLKLRARQEAQPATVALPPRVAAQLAYERALDAELERGQAGQLA